MRAYMRCGVGRYLEDSATIILLGHRTHLYNAESDEWFRVTDRPTSYESLRRPGGSIWAISWHAYWRQTGFRGLVEVAEDFMRFRLLSRYLDRRAEKRNLGRSLPPLTPLSIYHDS